MKLCVIAHSAVHARQQAFYQALARKEGVEVLVIAPERWGSLSCAKTQEGRYTLAPIEAINEGSMEHFTLPARKVVEAFEPDWIYVQNEPWHKITHQAHDWAHDTAAKLAVFSWENNRRLMNAATVSLLHDTALLVCGNTEARMLLRDFCPGRLFTDLQVGVRQAWFPFLSYDLTERLWASLFVSRLNDPMKGGQLLPALQQFLGDQRPICVPHRGTRLRYEAMHHFYHKAATLLTPSIELPWLPREQGPAYTNLEAMFCGTPVITTTSASIDEWLPPTVATKIPLEEVQNPADPSTMEPRPFFDAITGILGADPAAIEKRIRTAYHWVSGRFTNEAVALRLLTQLEAA